MNEDKAARYHRLRRRSVALAAGWSVLLLAGLLLTGFSHLIRDAAAALAAAARVPGYLQLPVTVAGWITMVGALHEIGALPIACFSGFLLERQYGLSRQSFGGWLREHFKALGVGLVAGVAAGVFVYGLLAAAPDVWWPIAWAASVVVSVVLMWAAPLIILPIFFRLAPLTEDALRQRLLALATRLGVPAIDVFEWRLSDRTSRANAVLTGIGRTRRILVSDTLVRDFDGDEVEVILAHELAHHVHRDVWRGLAFEAGLTGIALWAGSRVLNSVVGPLGLRGIDDVAGMPVLVLTLMAVSFVMLPLANALSRRFERRADRFALETTQKGDAFISAMRRLGARHLAEDAPSWPTRLLFCTHPPMADRIASVMTWKARQDGPN
jgi:STE24 endopeptidase